jgi:transcriptional regulator with XRE-family HTH domain
MADYMGLSNSAIGLYETDARLPKLAVLRVWAVRTGVPLEWLRYGDDQDFSDGPGGASTPTKCSHAYVLAEAA